MKPFITTNDYAYAFDKGVEKGRKEAAARIRELEALVSEGAATIGELLGYIEGEGMPGDYSAERALLARMGERDERS